jgi:hypothetical protein
MKGIKRSGGTFLPKVSSTMQAAKMMQLKGLSPRPAITESSFKDPYACDKTAWLPPSEIPSIFLTEALYASMAKTTSPSKVPLPPVLATSFDKNIKTPLLSKQPSRSPKSPKKRQNTPVDYSRDDTASPSVARSPSRRAKSPPPPAREESVSLEDPNTMLKGIGFTAYRVILLEVSSDALVFTVSPLGERMSIYYPREVVAPLLRGGAFFKGVQRDKVREMVLSTASDAEAICALDLARVVGEAAGSLNAGAGRPIFGSIVAASSSLVQEARYCAVFFSANIESSDPRGGNTFIYMQTISESDEEELDAKNLHATGVAPVVHSNLFPGSASEVSWAVRANSRQMETDFVQNERENSEGLVENLFESIDTNLRKLYERSLELLEIKESLTKSAVSSFKASIAKSYGPESVAIQQKLAALAGFSSKIEEVVGSTSLVVEASMRTAEAAVTEALASLFVESLGSGIGEIDARAWGYPKIASSIDVSKVCGIRTTSGKELSADDLGPATSPIREAIIKRKLALVVDENVDPKITKIAHTISPSSPIRPPARYSNFSSSTWN